MGLTAVRHLDDAWAILEQFGRSTSVKWSLQNLSLKVSAQGSWGCRARGGRDVKPHTAWRKAEQLL